ncbi:uncharacterized protein LOC118183711 [Stegodyphus dumicola]|uniref:uncharacterized protein LOC118183711 n=1 Tax=Stegodyphus dumicola TaxID=202533 RepID=UPI0015B32C0C|nr:uncharacterized protein LOC118183711 [Stegodyphus dumicola]
MLSLITFIAFLSVFSAASGIDEQCLADVVLDCIFSVGASDIIADRFDENEEMLDRKCEVMTKFEICVFDEAVVCPDISEDMYYQFYKDQYIILSKVCNKGADFRKKYLGNAKCLNKYMAQVTEKCGGVLEVIEAAYSVTKELCAKNKIAFECTFEEYERNCGKESSAVIKELLTGSISLTEKICSSFEPSDINTLRISLEMY